MINIFGYTMPELEALAGSLGQPAFRGRQLAEWIYGRGCINFEEMQNLPKAFRQSLMEGYVIRKATRVDKIDSEDGLTSKFLLQFADGVGVESVLMRQPYGNSLCISSQAGCAMGCKFCASTLHGVERDLTAGEMLAQTLFIHELLKGEGKKADTIVIMGSGEPLMNYDEVLKYIRLLHSDYCLGMSYRNITLSTSGIVPNIYRLAEEGIPVNLSISLHAPENDLRSTLMPINKKYPLAEVIAAGKHYGEKTKRRVTYEYILIADVNDTKGHAESLAALLKGQLASVNIIPINPVVERNWLRPSLKRINTFTGILEKQHIAVTVRREMGKDIQAACGQLRNKHLES